nr:hypothetical protein Iba_chr12fCG0830 [Ipomoea batatas]
MFGSVGFVLQCLRPCLERNINEIIKISLSSIRIYGKNYKGEKPRPPLLALFVSHSPFQQIAIQPTAARFLRGVRCQCRRVIRPPSPATTIITARCLQSPLRSHALRRWQAEYQVY